MKLLTCKLGQVNSRVRIRKQYMAAWLHSLMAGVWQPAAWTVVRLGETTVQAVEQVTSKDVTAGIRAKWRTGKPSFGFSGRNSDPGKTVVLHASLSATLAVLTDMHPFLLSFFISVHFFSSTWQGLPWSYVSCWTPWRISLPTDNMSHHSPEPWIASTCPIKWERDVYERKKMSRSFQTLKILLFVCCLYLDSMHKRIVAILQKLHTEFLQEQSDAEGWPSSHLLLGDGSPVLGSALWNLAVIKGNVVDVAQRTVVNQFPITDGLHVGHGVRSTKPGVPGGRGGRKFWMMMLSLSSALHQVPGLKPKLLNLSAVWNWKFANGPFSRTSHKEICIVSKPGVHLPQSCLPLCLLLLPDHGKFPVNNKQRNPTPEMLITWLSKEVPVIALDHRNG